MHQSGIKISLYLKNKPDFLEPTSTDECTVTDEETRFAFPGATTKNGLTTVTREEDDLKGRFFLI